MSARTQQPPAAVEQLSTQFNCLNVSTTDGAASTHSGHTAPPRTSWTFDGTAAARRSAAATAPVHASPQPLLQFVPSGSSAAATAAGVLSPNGQNGAAFFYAQNGGYYAAAPFAAAAASPTAYSPFPYAHAQWPVTNVNFMPNLFVMANAGPSHNFAPVPPAGMPPPLMQKSFGAAALIRTIRTHHGHNFGEFRGNSRHYGGNRGYAPPLLTTRQQHQMNAANRRQASKTALCRNMTDFNQCVYGDRCYFAHSADELKPKPTNIKYKTIPCTSFTQKGHCPYGNVCHFIHPLEDEPPASTAATAAAQPPPPPPDPQRR
ncbi:hypothetical protein M3Y99_01824800 [Aphelenchoides fujianensis]|nr:hypothetical protein M3Y99_01824800 [Aphelenchoides fujianensis]